MSLSKYIISMGLVRKIKDIILEQYYFCNKIRSTIHYSHYNKLFKANLKRIKANGNIVLKDFDAIYEDSTFVNTQKMSVVFSLPSKLLT